MEREGEEEEEEEKVESKGKDKLNPHLECAFFSPPGFGYSNTCMIELPVCSTSTPCNEAQKSPEDSEEFLEIEGRITIQIYLSDKALDIQNKNENTETSKLLLFSLSLCTLFWTKI